MEYPSEGPGSQVEFTRWLIQVRDRIGGETSYPLTQHPGKT